MGCVSSKEEVTVTPAAAAVTASSFSGRRDRVESEKSCSARSAAAASSVASWAADSAGRASSTNTTCGSESVSFRLHKYVEGDQIAAGWPAWLCAVAAEAIHGWIPLRPDSFDKLEKIGQGTYSSVFRARDHETGKIVALKKVRFDNFEPESVRFMAREILILRRLDHPNVIKLEGIITSTLSSSIYLVFEYMEHDLSGLSSCPEINFTESQVKCYMKQLLSGLEHCHSHGVMHRDIKGSNLLINNEGILKVADFGLANFSTSNNQPMTNRVVTLWYRPPELLLGATNYTHSVDLWSVGCVFAEILLKKPLLQGRTEVEQLHKIFKLCGSPPDEYWKKSRLPHATLFKPQQHYIGCLHEICKDLPRPALNLIETLLSVEPSKRATASSALDSEYFVTKPYACDPSSLPKYPPNKEIDAKCRQEARKKRQSGRARGINTLRKASRRPNGIRKLAPTEVSFMRREQPKTSIDVKNVSQVDEIPYSGPIQVPSSSGFAWAKNRREEASMRSYSRSSSKTSLNGLEQLPPSTSVPKMNLQLALSLDKASVMRKWSQLERPDSFDDCDEEYHSQGLSLAFYKKELEAKRNKMDQDDGIEFSGPLLSQSHRNIDELLEKHERRICQAVRRSWFQRGKKNEK